MPPIIKVSEHWIVVKTSMLSDGDKAILIDAGFRHPFLKSGAENTGVLLRKKNAGDTPPNNVADLIALYSKPNAAMYGEIPDADMAELEALIASLGLERGGQRKSRKSRKNKSRRSRKNKSRK
jgi:hypothetical protein